MSVRLSPRGVVDCRTTLDLPIGATSVWGQLRDFHRYAQQDFFHCDMKIDGGVPRAGAKLTLAHRYGNIQIERIGRILVWREGVGYSFSDLSLRGPRRGFPHVFSYRLQSLGEAHTLLHISVRGRWTARWLPRWAAWVWLNWVFGQVVRNVKIQMMVYQIWREEKQR